MKKLIFLLLALTMVLGLLAGCNNNAAPEQTEAPTEASTEPEAVIPASALEVLESVWGLYGEDEKFPVMGGDANNMVDGAPGAYSLEDREMLAYQLLVPADQAESIDDAAALFHGMMLNNFTCGVFHVTGDTAAFADAMRDAVMNNQWMCGFPEKLIIGVIGGEYVLMAFGIGDAIDPFQAKLLEAYPEAELAYNEPIA